MFPLEFEALKNLINNNEGPSRILDWLLANLPLMVFVLFVAIATILVARIVNHLMESHFKRVSSRLRMNLTTFRMLRHLTVSCIYFLGIVVVVSSIPNLERLSTALFTGAGVAGIVIGFAAQSTLSNIIAGISLVAFQPFRVGDRVTVHGEYGKVTDINLRHTTITTWDNRRLIIPNALISGESVINWTIEDPAILWPIDIGIGYDSDIDRARAIMIEEAKKHPDVMTTEKIKSSLMKPSFVKSELLPSRLLDLNLSPVTPSESELLNRGEIEVLVTDLGDFAVNLRMQIWFKDRSLAFNAGCEIREAIKKRFDREGIEIPYPYRTIVYKTKKENMTEKKESTEENDTSKAETKGIFKGPFSPVQPPENYKRL